MEGIPAIKTKVGVAVFLISWVVLAAMLARSGSCLQSATCGAGDAFLGMIGGVGMLAPAYILGLTLDGLFGRTNVNDDQ